MGDVEGRWRTGYASGAFDLLHVGHVRYLRAAAARCERLLVGVPSDAIVARVKGRPPLMPQAERREIIAALSGVAEALAVSVGMDDAVAFSDVLVGLGVDVALIGQDWEATPRWCRLRPRLEARGIAVLFLPRVEGVSSSDLRRRVAERASSLQDGGFAPP